MALKDLFNSIKKEGYVTKPLDMYLIKKTTESNDRAINVNAPSQAGNCLRANYYARKQVKGTESGDIARTQRIFDNGSYTHLRIQDYLTEMGMLLLDEVPLINDEYNIQGHTDGFLDLEDEVAILEIKTINDNGFNQLKDAKDYHKQQGLIYLFCAEERRKYLHNKYKTRKAYEDSEEERAEYFRKHYQHLQDGDKHTREEKIANEVRLNLISDDILYDTEKPIDKVIFLYENKDNQMLKEFVLERNSDVELLEQTLSRYKALNEFCDKDEIPPREGENKSCSTCRFCNYKNECWIL